MIKMNCQIVRVLQTAGTCSTSLLVSCTHALRQCHSDLPNSLGTATAFLNRQNQKHTGCERDYNVFAVTVLLDMDK